ncbi:hypothetical protein NP233_g7464 [Leucocoprinus birnbaumii]|uniref:histidine kinase n=1 Tax=Leucocoprinus birnbaumii TaxID=56174 RepID=A0AAD5YSR5_9AGAR|nr:hypothetical protein NP233_g7464 [Leucocoprinus birnbaumii]
MPSWLRRLTGDTTRWTDEEDNLGPPLRISVGEKSPDLTKSTMATPATSTHVEHLLPPPVCQSNTPLRVRTISPRLNFGVQWLRLKKQLGVGVAPSNSSLNGDSSPEDFIDQPEDLVDDDGDVDLTVVDRVWFEELKSSESTSDNGNNSPPPHEKSAVVHTGHSGTANTRDNDSVINENTHRLFKPLVAIRYNFYPTLREFFFTRFEDERSEDQYAKEDWILKKSLAIWAALWLIVNWLLGVAFLDDIHHPVKGDIAFYFVIGPLLAFPVLWMVVYDWPRSRPISYQLFLTVAIWAWGFYFVLYLKTCGYYLPKSTPPNTFNTAACARRDFLSLFFYTTALQTMGLFGLKLNRLMAALGAFSFFVMTAALMIPLDRSWVRNMICFFVFHFFLIYVHYMRENSERRLYTLRYQLKVQYRATRKAQMNERKAADSKRRLTSYVRVPLNTALLAVQNMEASCNIMKDQQIEFNALSGSLSMMSKVLNDVLDFNKMDSGKFESASRPYAFHQVMQSLFIPLGLTTDARNLALETYLDPNIDIIARKAAYEALGEQDIDAIRRHIKENPNAPGVVTGDETRLRQVVTNLASNACKFTPTGGKLTIRTKLVLPSIPPGQDPLVAPQITSEDRADDNLRSNLSISNLSQHDSDLIHEIKEIEEKAEDEKTHSNGRTSSSKSPSPQIVVRIEVEDTGYGIRRSDMHKLFTAFNQTEQGRQQGGKGTGLGLALVRQIVKLSGGRLGVQSKVGQGSIFWVELPLGIGHEAIVNQQPIPEPPMSQGINHIEYVHEQALMRVPTLEGDSSAPVTPDDSKKGKEFSEATAAMHATLMDQVGRVELKLRDRDSDRISARIAADPSTGTQYSYPQTSAQEDEDDVTVQDGSTVPTATSTALTTPNERSPMVTPRSEKGEDGKAISPTSTPNARGPKNPPSPTNGEAVPPASGTPIGGTPNAATPTSPTPDPQENEEKDEQVPAIPPVAATKRTIQRPTFVQLPSPRQFSIDTTLPSPSAMYTPAISSYSTTSTSPLAMFDAAHVRGSPSSLNAGMNFEPAAGMSVLVVDDDSLTRTLMKRILTRLGCHVSVAENGEVALEMILGRRISVPTSTPSSDYSKREAKPILEQEVRPGSTSASTPTGISDEYKYAVVFLDNQMPVMSGLKVVAKLRELGRKDFVVGVTGNALLSDQQEYLEAGVDKVLTKPVLERSLRDALQAADERRKNISREASSTEGSSGGRVSPPKQD